MLRAAGAAIMLMVIVGGLTACQAGGRVAFKVGDCINNTNTDDGDDTVVVDCAQPHDQEVFHTFDMPDGDFPGYYELGDAQQDECSSAFEEYVGAPWVESSYSFDSASPTEVTWGQGDRTITCFLEDASGGELTGSARDTAQ